MKTMSIRLPDDVATQLARLAELECRSMNQEIEYALRCYIATRQDQPLLKIKLEPDLPASH
jgi:predicted transcriptional regulator